MHLVLAGVSWAVVLVGVALAGLGAPLVWCLLVLAVAPWVTVVGHGWVGRRGGGTTDAVRDKG